MSSPRARLARLVSELVAEQTDRPCSYQAAVMAVDRASAARAAGTLPRIEETDPKLRQGLEAEQVAKMMIDQTSRKQKARRAFDEARAALKVASDAYVADQTAEKLGAVVRAEHVLAEAKRRMKGGRS